MIEGLKIETRLEILKKVIAQLKTEVQATNFLTDMPAQIYQEGKIAGLTLALEIIKE